MTNVDVDGDKNQDLSKSQECNVVVDVVWVVVRPLDHPLHGDALSIQDWYYLPHHYRHHLSHHRNLYIAQSSISLQISEANIRSQIVGQLTTPSSLSTPSSHLIIIINTTLSLSKKPPWPDGSRYQLWYCAPQGQQLSSKLLQHNALQSSHSAWSHCYY